MNRRRRAWLIFAAMLGLALVAVAGLSRMILRLDAEGAAARRQAVVEENVRLALWRMDAALSLLVARESLRPYFEFRPFVAIKRPWVDMFDPIGPDESFLASPLLIARSEHVLLHFQMEADGSATSPEAPPEDMVAAAVQRGASRVGIQIARDRLGRLQRIAPRLQHAPRQLPAEAQPPPIDHLPQCDPETDDCDGFADNGPATQEAKNVREFAMRGINNSGGYPNLTPTASLAPTRPPRPPRPVRMFELPEDVMAPVWQDGELFLVRTVTVNNRKFVQGCWLDWSELSSWLLKGIHDLLPHATLSAATGPRIYSERRLTALPIDLTPGAITVRDEAGGAPAWLVLVVAWTGVVLAGAAIGLLLMGTMDLSERRGAFVSAVTHELRTPLTTFRMYTEMLGEGMVKTPEQQQTYLATLRREADRLSHLVENVLSYSRVEEGRLPASFEPMDLQPFLDRTWPRLAERAAQAGMQLVVEVAQSVAAARVRADSPAVEQILFNLVDNACKYAAGALDRRIHLQVEAGDHAVMFRVRDHGPGVPPEGLVKLFVPFSKSAAQAAATAPGVGLGLALCQRLARSRSGDLRYAGTDAGAEFLLTLPA